MPFSTGEGNPSDEKESARVRSSSGAGSNLSSSKAHLQSQQEDLRVSKAPHANDTGAWEERLEAEPSELWMRKKADEGKWESEGDEYGVRTLMNDIVDWFINMYGLLRASRTDLDSTHRLIYFGEHHRR